MCLKISVFVPENATLYEVLREKGFMKSAYCGGRGTCKKCVVKIDGKKELACLIKGPFKGEVELSEENFLSKGEKLEDIEVDSGKTGYGVSIDLGTTGVEVALFNLSTGKFLKSLKALNLQSAFGADVVTRVELARENYEKERELLLKTINFLLRELGVKVKEAVVVSNPVLHHFLLGLPVSGFEKYPFKLQLEEEVEVIGKELGLEDFPETLFYVPPPLKNFIGSDFLSNVLFLEQKGYSNFLVSDLGTNAEMGIYGEEKIATSVPAGPAFEGVGLFSGLRALPGSIYKVFFDGRAFRFLTIGGTKPLGICASGYFDAIYLLKSFKVLNREGTFTEVKNPLLSSYIREIGGQKAFVLYDDGETLIAITQDDIRKFLLAKGAVFGGHSALLSEAKVPEKLFFSGAFGTHLDRRSLKGVGLIPEELPDPTPVGNAALKGASLIVGRTAHRKRLKELKREFEVLELAGNKLFEKRYIEGMEFFS